MIQQESKLRVADNTGAKEIQCIRVEGGTGRRYARVGDIIIVSVKKAIPGGELKKGSISRPGCLVIVAGKRFQKLGRDLYF